MELEFAGQIFEKSSNIKFNENPSMGSRVTSYGQTDGRKATWKPTVCFYNFPSATQKRDKNAEFCAEFRESKQP
jgi:hypothetical protein